MGGRGGNSGISAGDSLDDLRSTKAQLQAENTILFRKTLNSNKKYYDPDNIEKNKTKRKRNQKNFDIFSNTTYKHIILTSGRTGTKPSFAAVKVVCKIVADDHGAVVVLRKHHNKLRKTVYKETLRGISRLGINKKAFRINLTIAN